MTTTVTGAAGFLGRALVGALVDAGETVIAVDRAPSALPGATTLTADLLDRDERVEAALATADRVFHLAGCPGVRDRRPDIEARRHRDNVLATARVLALVPPRTPLVVTSSSSVYGGTAGGRPSVEGDPLRPRGGYARSKVAAERLCLARLEAGAAVAVARPFTVAGEGQRPDMALARWIDAARHGRPLRLYGSDLRTRDVTDVRDAVRALVALTECGVRGVVNIGTGSGHTLRAMVDAVGAALDREVRTCVEPAGPAEVADTLADTRRLRTAVGWTPVTDLPALVARQVAATDGPDVTARAGAPVAAAAAP